MIISLVPIGASISHQCMSHALTDNEEYCYPVKNMIFPGLSMPILMAF